MFFVNQEELLIVSRSIYLLLNWHTAAILLLSVVVIGEMVALFWISWKLDRQLDPQSLRRRICSTEPGFSDSTNHHAGDGE